MEDGLYLVVHLAPNQVHYRPTFPLFHFRKNWFRFLSSTAIDHEATVRYGVYILKQIHAEHFKAQQQSYAQKV